MIEQSYYSDIWRIKQNIWNNKFNVGKRLIEPKPFEDHNLLPKYKFAEPVKKHSLIQKIIKKIWK